MAKVHNADSVNKIGEAYDKLLNRLNTRIADLEERVDALESQLRKYVNWTARLVKQLVEHGIEPAQPPDTGELMKKRE